MTATSPAASVDATQTDTSEGRPITLAHVKALIEREREIREAMGEELTYEQKLAHDHATTFVRLPVEQADELRDRLLATTKITEAQAVKIVDICPMHPDDVRAILAKDRVQLDNDEIAKILDLVKGYIA